MRLLQVRPKAAAALLALLVLAGTLLSPGDASAAVTVRDLPESDLQGCPFSCTVGRDGAIWFTEHDVDMIGRYDPETQSVDEYPIPGGISDGGYHKVPKGMTTGADGLLWFCEENPDGGDNSYVGFVDTGKTPPEIREVKVFNEHTNPQWITTGPDGALWFVEARRAAVCRIDTREVGYPDNPVIDRYPLGDPDSAPVYIAPGPDGRLWFTENGAGRLGAIDPLRKYIEEYDTASGDGSRPAGFCAGPDGAVWYAEQESDKIVRLDPADPGNQQAHDAGDYPTGIMPGPDGALWITELQGNNIRRLDPADPENQEVYPLPTDDSQPAEIIPGPKGSMWFCQLNNRRIGQVEISPFTITASVLGGHGTIDPFGEVKVDNDADQEFTITPDPHYRVSRLTVDGEDKAPATEWEFKNVVSNHSIEAEFEMITHEIRVSAGPHGKITPAGTGGLVKVADGADQAFAITPDPGYGVRDVVVDGKSVGPRSAYAFRKVTGDHAISASFAPAGPPPPPPPPPPPTTWYLAEGTTDWGFSTCISIQNPNPAPVQARVTYMPTGRDNVTENVTLPAESQTTITNDALLESMGGPCDFSTKVEGSDKTKPIAVDRTMEWTGPGAASPEGHSSIGVTSAAKTWYLPEGSASWGFETWLLIQNPQDKEASCQVTYMIENVGPRTVEKKVPARSRASFNMADDMPDVEIKDASIKVESSVPVIPERAMYRNDRREGHDSIGTTEQAKEYYLAEGATGWNVGYTTWVLVQNPGDKPNDVKLTYQTAGGPVDGPAFQMSPNSRKTVRVNDTLPPDTDVSTLVRGSAPVIAERAMYWDNGTGEACHASIGLSSPHDAFMLPDGQTSQGRETWTLVQNPGKIPVEIRVSYLPAGGGKPTSFSDVLASGTRKTYNMAEKGVEGRAAVLVETVMGGPVIVERAMYWNSRGAGTCTIGAQMPSRRRF